MNETLITTARALIEAGAALLEQAGAAADAEEIRECHVMLAPPTETKLVAPEGAQVDPKDEDVEIVEVSPEDVVELAQKVIKAGKLDAVKAFLQQSKVARVSELEGSQLVDFWQAFS